MKSEELKSFTIEIETPARQTVLVDKVRSLQEALDLVQGRISPEQAPGSGVMYDKWEVEGNDPVRVVAVRDQDGNAFVGQDYYVDIAVSRVMRHKIHAFSPEEACIKAMLPYKHPSSNPMTEIHDRAQPIEGSTGLPVLDEKEGIYPSDYEMDPQEFRDSGLMDDDPDFVMGLHGVHAVQD